MLLFMKNHRQRTNRSRSYAKIMSVRTSFRFYANGPRAVGKTAKTRRRIEAAVIGWRDPKRNQR